MAAKLEIGQYVYHADVYDFRERLEIVGLKKDMVELRGDYSGMGSDDSSSWLPIKGKVSRVYNHAEKVKARERANEIIEKYRVQSDKPVVKMFVPENAEIAEGRKDAFEAAKLILKLTEDVSINPIYTNFES